MRKNVDFISSSITTSSSNSDLTSTKKMSKQLKTAVTCSCFLAIGICRTVQGPALIDLQAQTQLSAADFQIIFLLCTISFPLGNYFGGILIDRFNRYVYMALVSFFTGLFFMVIPFTTGLWSLCFVSVTAEFFMGLVDTGCNVSILRLWNDATKGPAYFTCLHFCFGIGNLFGPIMAEMILTETSNETITAENIVNNNNITTTSILDDDESILGPSHLEQDVWQSMVKSLELTHLQILHIIIFGKLLMNTLMFVICSFLKDDDDDNSKLALDDLPKPKLDELESKSESDEKIMNRTYPYLRIGFISCMTFMFAIANGLNFAYSNFVTKFAVNSNLSLNKSQGARLTAIYFGCSALMKFITIGLLRIFKPIRLIIFNVIILAAASLLLLTFANDNIIAYQSGTALAGIGVSTLFSNGVVWIQSQLNFGSQVTALFIIACTIGAQVVKIPAVAWIDTYPMSLMWIFTVCTIGISVLFMISKALCITAKYLIPKQNSKNEDNNNVDAQDDSSEKSLLGV